jgi:predicted nucleic acid-binding protein
VKPVLLDTGVIVALIDRRERYHARCVDLVESLERPLVTCEVAIAESCYLLRALPGGVEAVLENIERGMVQIPFHLSQSATPVRTLLKKYRDLPASLADACLIHLADRFDTGDILTLDRDFLTYRWRRNRPFRFLVEFLEKS